MKQYSSTTRVQVQVPSTTSLRETIELLTMETPEFIPPTFWPPNSPDLNPVDYKVWSIMQEKVYKKRITDIDELRARILTAWDEMDQRIIDAAIRVAHTFSCMH